MWNWKLTSERRSLTLCAYCNYLLPRLWRHKFWKAVFSHVQKVKTKIWIASEGKELLRWNKKTFFITFKEFSVVRNCLGSDGKLLSYHSNFESTHREVILKKKLFLNFNNAKLYFFSQGVKLFSRKAFSNESCWITARSVCRTLSNI